MTMRKKVLAVTGARSEYDLLSSVYRRLHEDPRFEFGIVVTGPHLSDRFGSTARFIEEDGFPIVGRIYNLLDTDRKIGRIASIGLQIPSLANLLDQERPDLVLVAGDREEAITVTMTCAFLDLAVAHFFGGDIAKDGNIDNSVRYAASKFAHLHFPTLPQHRETLLRLGEESERIFVVGNPALDRLIETPSMEREAVLESLGAPALGDRPYCVLIQHPIITQTERQQDHIRRTLEAVLNSGVYCFANYPNSDAGFGPIVRELQAAAAAHPEAIALFTNLDRLRYVNLLRHAAFLIGNSSSGILEVASLGLPAINVGERQRGRVHGGNVLFVDHDTEQIARAIDRVLRDEAFLAEVARRENPYGDGHSAEKIVEVLAQVEITDALLHKNITY